MITFSNQLNEWLQEQIGPQSTIKNIKKLPGSTSAELYDLTISRFGSTSNLVLRLFTLEDWLSQEPDLALHEAHALKLACQAQLPVPEAIAFDEDGSKCGTPAVLMTKLSGEGNLKPENMRVWLEELAKSLSLIHQIEAEDFLWRYFSYTDLSKADVPQWTSQPELWSKALQIVKGDKPDVCECFIHRDYHPANVLWDGVRISGVVDWVNACRGPAGVDLGHCRANLVMLYGVETADQLLHEYQKARGSHFHYDLYYDLLALCDFVLPGPPTVYSGWEAFGITHLTDQKMRQRADQYLISLMTER